MGAFIETGFLAGIGTDTGDRGEAAGAFPLGLGMGLGGGPAGREAVDAIPDAGEGAVVVAGIETGADDGVGAGAGAGCGCLAFVIFGIGTGRDGCFGLGSGFVSGISPSLSSSSCCCGARCACELDEDDAADMRGGAVGAAGRYPGSIQTTM